jgi:phosphatidylinositol alpha 1,6-mannosyltransferase
VKIALVTESFPPRVDETSDTARHLVDGLLRHGHELLVVTMGTGQASYRGVRVVRARRLVSANAVNEALDSFGTQHLVALRPHLLGSLALRHGYRRGLPTLAIDPPAVHARAGRTLATNRDRLENLAQTGTRAQLWSPGVDLDDHHPGLHDPRLRTEWAKGHRLVVGHAGDATRAKVVDRLCRIATLPDVRLVVFGEGPAASTLRAAGAKVTGSVSGLDLARGIASVDVLVQVRKKDEHVPGVRRALASGVPVVGFDAGGTRDVVVDGHNGLLADPGYDSALRRLIGELADPDLRSRLAGHARESVADRSWQVALDELAGHLPVLV